MSDQANAPNAVPYTLTFGIKSAKEVEVDGQLGLVLPGFASKYFEVDAESQFQTPTSFQDVVDEWGAEPQPMVWYQHGKDAALGCSRIGHALSYDLNPDGFTVESFLPKDRAYRSAAKTKRYRQVYAGVKSGDIRGYSVGGMYVADGPAILRWSMSELSITPRPCLASAVFTVGTKAISEQWGDVPLIGGDPLDADTDDSGEVYSSTTTSFQQADAYTATLAELAARVQALEDGAKAVMKSEQDGHKHPASHYLVVGDPGKVTTWHLQVKHTDSGYDHGLCSNAYAAITSNFRGNPYQGPDKQAALAKLKRIYSSQGWDWPGDSKKSGKTALEALLEQRPDLYAAALSVLRDGTKVGRRHSAKDKALVQGVIKTLNDHFLSEDTSDLDADQSGTANPDYPARNAVIA